MRPNSPPQTTAVSWRRRAALEIANESGGCAIHVGAAAAQVLVDARVIIPGLARAIVDMNGADAALDETAREEAAVRER